MVKYNRDKFFDSVRKSLFAGKLSQKQVDGMNAILGEFERRNPGAADSRFLAYPLGTTYHETAQTMQPIEEYGKGKTYPYGKMDPETKQTYYGRGYVQLTWRDNYAKVDDTFYLSGDKSLEWHADNALEPKMAADIMFEGMEEGWFRSDSKGKQTMKRYFNATMNDPYGAREIINGDKTKIPNWSNGVSIGNLIAGYHQKFLSALVASVIVDPTPEPNPLSNVVVAVDIVAPEGVTLEVTLNGKKQP